MIKIKRSFEKFADNPILILLASFGALNMAVDCRKAGLIFPTIILVLLGVSLFLRAFIRSME
jgi:hypothetical protein